MKFVAFLPFLFLNLSSCRSALINSSQITKSPQVQGHRGSRGTHPENSIPGFEEALLAGSDWIELDLVLSKEGVPVVSHDPIVSVDLCLDRLKKPLIRMIPINSQTLKELKTYDCGSVPNPDFPEQKPVPGQSFVTLEEVLIWKQRFPEKKVRFNIETKTGATRKQFEPNPRKFVDSIIRLLRKYHQIENSVLQSFDFRTLSEAKKMEPALKLSALFDKPDQICKVTKQLGAQIASPRFAIVTKALVDDCHSFGIEVHPWTLNDESDWKKALTLGVDGIITDYPRKLIAFLRPKASQ